MNFHVTFKTFKAKVSYRYPRMRETTRNLVFAKVRKTATTALWFSSFKILNILGKS
jgi:hypothetical protein